MDKKAPNNKRELFFNKMNIVHIVRRIIHAGNF